MVDTYVSGAYGEICVGSSPISDTIKEVIKASFFNIFSANKNFYLDVLYNVCLALTLL